MNPIALVTQDPVSHHWVAFNEDARMIAHRKTQGSLDLALAAYGYSQVSPNSRAAATIRDKLRLRYPSIHNEEL
jgi:hypothetical protein